MRKVPAIVYVNEGEELSESLRMNLDQKQKDVLRYSKGEELTEGLVLDNTPLYVYVENIDQFPNEVYALLRKNGLGGSDSSALLGVNPFTTRAELIAEKTRNFLTEEEKKIGDLTPVKKGRDLEPLIIQKFSSYLGDKIMKPTDMYGFTDYPYLKMNFDGVTGTPEQYIPCEIKVVTMYGEKHYDRTKAWFSESTGFGPLPEDISERNWSIETKAAYYGFPPYYYTQLQQEIFALNAPFGYLATMWDKEWQIHAFFVWRDQKVIDAITIEGYKVWQEIERRRGPNWHLPDGMDSISMEQSQSIQSGTDPIKLGPL